MKISAAAVWLIAGCSVCIADNLLEDGGIATPFIYEPALAAGDIRLKLHPFDPGENLVLNSSFEKEGEDVPKEWVWEQRSTDAKLSVLKEGGYSGENAVKISSTTPFGAHIYSCLRMAEPVKVKPGTSYTISAFIKTGDRTSGSWIGGGKGWKVRRAIPTTNGRWERISHTFVTAEDESEFMLRVLTEHPTEGVWLDDISLREGTRPVPGTLEGARLVNSIDLSPSEGLEVLYKGRSINTRWAPQRWPRDTWAFIGNELKAEGVVTIADTEQTCAVVVILKNEKGIPVAQHKTAVKAGTQAAFITLKTVFAEQAPESVTIQTRLLHDQTELCSHENTFRVVTAERVLARIKPLKATLSRLKSNVEKLEKKGVGAYSRVTLTVLENFIPWVESDVADERTDRAWDTVNMLAKMVKSESSRAADILAGKTEDFTVPRYQTGNLKISRAQTIGSQRFPDGRSESAPVFFTGYGHFNQVRRDVEKFPGYGCNFLQIEFGPRSVLPHENDYSDQAITGFLAICDRAAASNVAVNLLLSPHYFPEWALEKWPHLKECQGGFFKYCVHDSDARSVIERSLRYVIPRIKDHPAIHSLCLSNEPISVDLQNCKITAREWPRWLEKQHTSIKTLNNRWGTTYASFKEIPVPAPEFRATSATLDFVRYNQETFAAFHRWMADIIHSMAPEMPVHTKIMMGAHFQRQLHGMWSVSPELFAELSQYNGNDAYNMYSQNNARWSNGWRHCQAGYDFQRSMADIPVFNSENHIITDRDCNVIPPEHIYSVLWQNAVHGQSSTTIWVWERTNDHLSGFTGSILHRPDCVEAVGRCNLDLNRLSCEMAAIQNLSPSICLLWSTSSEVLGSEHDYHVGTIYEAANFLGQPLGFATERKLAEFARSGKLPRPLDSAKVVILPGVTHLPDDARKALSILQDKGVQVVVYGESAVKNDYNEARKPDSFESLPEAPGSEELFALLTERVSAWNLPATAQLVDTTGKPVFGVEIRSVPYGGGVVATICNHLRKPQKVTLKGVPNRTLKELISGRSLKTTFVVEPMRPMMIEVK